MPASGLVRAEPNGYNIDTERPQREVELASAQLQQMRQLIKAQLAKREEQAAVLQAQIEGLQQECKAKELQVQEVVAHLDKPEGSDLFHRAQCASSEIKKQLHQQYHAKNAQVQQLQMETSQLSKDCDHSQKQAEQLARDFQALQHEHQRLTVTFEGEQQHSRLLQDDVSQLQTYSSALEEDLNKAQAHLLDLLLNGEESLSSKQNDILKAAAKQVIEFKAREAKRSKMPRLLRTFSSLKKERGSYILEDAEKLVSLPPSQPLSPGGAGTPFTPRAMSLSRSVSGITTASSTASMIKIGQDPFGSSGGDVSPLTPAQTEAASGCQRLKAENDILIEKLAQAHQDMAKLSSRLVDAAFSNAHACLPDISAPSSAQLNH
ncbi:hypothetical protein WJX79_008381 [Trebouxia sp. C0005]